jgi:alkanesulfonate monooxygenase SsuD/methylene tetrahydromethanopterin reductase-like flavin-dependent oxidoreductase (luciferase family)
VARLHEEARRAGRDPATIDLAYRASWYKEGQTLELDDGQRQVFTGSDAEVARDIEAFRTLGVRHLLFSFARASLPESIAAMERFAEQVLTQV